MPSWDIKPGEPQQVPSRKGSIIILITHRDERDYRQWRDWYHFKLQKPVGTSWRESRGASLVTARNGLVRDALNTDSEYFFFLDDDIIGPDNGLITLMSLKLPIAGGLYWSKKKKEERGLSAWMKNPSGGHGYLAISPEQKARHIQVDVTGLGFALFHRSIFERLSEPYFDWPPDGPSEDFWLYEKIWRELQIKPVIDMEVRCKHIGLFMIEGDGSFTTLGL